MPEGQFTGQRGSYVYTNDEGNTYLLTLDQTLGDIVGNGLVAATSTTVAGGPPARFKPRVVFWQGTLNGREVRKSIVCNSDGSLYTDVSQALTIDGVAGVTTGRRGEKLTYVRLPA